MINVNLGCGDQYAPGWLNVDHGSPHRKDLDVDLTGELPWWECSIHRAYAGHVLEHLTLAQCDVFLRRLRTRMILGGELVVVGPDLERAQALVDADELLDISLGELRDGAGRWSGDVHHWECTPSKIIDMLITTGWSNVEEIEMRELPDIWPVAYRAPRWQCVVTAIRT